MDTFKTPKPPRLSVELRAGTLTVDTAETNETTVEITPLNDTDVTLEALIATTVDQRGDDVVVHVPNRFSFIGRSPRLAVTITAPHGSRLGVKTGSADVVAMGQFGTSTVSTGSGDLTLGDFGDSLRINSGSGAVRVSSVARDVVVKTGSGDIDVVEIEGEATLSSGSGDVVVGGATRGLDAKTGSGNITVGTAPRDLRVTTASGDIRIDVATEGEVRAKAASGDIHAGVATGTAAWLEVRTVSGRVASGLDTGGEPAADERRVRLELTTVSGDIKLERV
jgi:DUF4097 and DUF4098 domain-containing protein YvlB